ncbi:hypothetical protein H9P43_009626 [Blastocladiella emersonii ATCC 22665]|nr:hypothetical protein H9P43_009626 [Blastocladiella emersonii ATCC 22665]
MSNSMKPSVETLLHDPVAPASDAAATKPTEAAAKLNRFNNTEWIDKVNPQPHRCNDPYLEDLIAAVQTWPLEVRGPWKAFWACMRTKEGEPMPPRYQRTQPIEYQPKKPERGTDPLAFLKGLEDKAKAEIDAATGKKHE